VFRPNARPEPKNGQFISLMDRRRRRQKEERERELESALISAEECFANVADECEIFEDEATDLTEEVDWSSVPECLDPACKEAELHKEGRAHRKRQQLASIVHHVRKILKPQQTCIEFGAGSGHLSLLLSWLFPLSNFIMCERKEYSVAAAKTRIQEVFWPILEKILRISILYGSRPPSSVFNHLDAFQVGLSNCNIFLGDAACFDGGFDLGVRLPSIAHVDKRPRFLLRLPHQCARNALNINT
jgi:hypothetical protein